MEMWSFVNTHTCAQRMYINDYTTTPRQTAATQTETNKPTKTLIERYVNAKHKCDERQPDGGSARIVENVLSVTCTYICIVYI